MEDKSLSKLQQENLELTTENLALKEAITTLLIELDKVKLIEPRPSNVEKIVLSTEQLIIEDQINRLNTVSLQRVLSLEETRALDLLIKNKRLLEPNTPIEPDYTRVPDGQSESDLLRIAGSVESKKSPKRSKSKTSQKDPVA